MKYIWLEILPETDREGNYKPLLRACHTCNEYDFLLALSNLIQPYNIKVSDLLNEDLCDNIENTLRHNLLKRGAYIPFFLKNHEHRYYLTKFVTYVAWKTKGQLQIDDQRVRKIYF
ncbi:cupin domain-containing protein [Catalinimonas niigatensis]|uniref:hypothetical protein n=1 Tax=Catalinimonas niigatensis TaxID=1397264 RepID=UPI002665E646|nr:hypothetical protein [Catalinimonas niigatensis]WPP48968.1 hypothetical protein PZB72_20075 [Catalinimonas niigatensis]